MDNKSQLTKTTGNNNGPPQECAGCGKIITERWVAHSSIL